MEFLLLECVQEDRITMAKMTEDQMELVVVYTVKTLTVLNTTVELLSNAVENLIKALAAQQEQLDYLEQDIIRVLPIDTDNLN